jgi:hypothetical protein
MIRRRILALLPALAACSSDVLVEPAEVFGCPAGLYMVRDECGTCEGAGESPCRTADGVPGWCTSTRPAEPREWRCERYDAIVCGGVSGCTPAGSACVAPDAGTCPEGCCSTWHP